VPLTFTEDGVTYRASILEDGNDINHLRSSEKQVTAKSRIKLSLAASGGAVVVLSPVSK
jgi:alpha-glucosidase